MAKEFSRLRSPPASVLPSWDLSPGRLLHLSEILVNFSVTGGSQEIYEGLNHMQSVSVMNA